jgi:peroxiredoxin Q/BCP
MSERKQLQPGDKLPNISGINEKGEKINLSDFRGKKLIVFFYPADMTPGCINEVCNLRDNYTELKEAGYKLLGVSTDGVSKHQRFIDRYKLPFSLIADFDKLWVHAFGVYGPKTFMGRLFQGTHRVTFVADEQGVIEQVIDKVKTKDHAGQILEAIS